jgi:hypothetical protein
MGAIGSRRDAGQASAELAGVLPAFIVAVLIAAQLALTGYALWSAGIAARAGARAAQIGDDAGAAAQRALPGRLGRGARVESGDGVAVRVRVPRLLPFLPAFSVRARADLGGS